MIQNSIFHVLSKLFSLIIRSMQQSVWDYTVKSDDITLFLLDRLKS